MNNLCRSCALATVVLYLVLGYPSAPAEGEEWNIRWENGTKITSPEKKYDFKIGGRLQADYSWVSADEEVDDRFNLEDDSEFRRARLYAEGTFYKKVKFKVQYDWASGDPEIKDAYVEVKKVLGLNGIRIGHQKEPFGLSQITSSKFIAFVERPSADDAFNEGRNNGIVVHDTAFDKRLSWSAGIFNPTDSSAQRESTDVNVTGRITGLPIYEEKGRRLLHLGLSFSERSPVDDLERLRARPGAHLSPRFVDTGRFASDMGRALGLEVAGVRGPLWWSAEGFFFEGGVSGARRNFSGTNFQVGYYFTGEHRRYKTSSGAWDRQRPRSPVGSGGASGAWEVAARYSSVDLTDGSVRGGELSNLAVAVHWYPNSATRVMLDYVRPDLDGIGQAEFVVLRFQVEF